MMCIRIHLWYSYPEFVSCALSQTPGRKCLCTCVDKHTSIHMHMHMHMYTYLHMHMFVYVYVFVHVEVHVYVYVFALCMCMCIHMCMCMCTHLQATPSCRDMRCMHRPPASPCTCLPRRPRTCRRWAPCTRCCTRSLRARRLLHSRAHRCARTRSQMQTHAREKIYVHVCVRACACVCMCAFPHF